MPLQEKRKFPRKSVDVPVSLALAGTGVPVQGVCRDISIGGMYVITEARAPFGSGVVVEMAFPGVGIMKMQATVRWTGPDGIGLQFGALGAKETHGIVQLLKAQR